MSYQGIDKVCLYLRYSSNAQSEQSIEGQMRVCRDWCQRNDVQIVETYIDRATSALSHAEKRVEFQRMIRDSEKGRFEAVLVYKLDRFSRNRYDSATYKYRLKKNGVRLISATENLTDSPESIILESVLEGMAEFYSVELAQKVSRGMKESAYKHQVTGGTIPLGYKSVNKQLVIDPVTAPIVQEIFKMYDQGESFANMCKILNDKGYRSSSGAHFNKNSFRSLLRNEKYIGVYHYMDYRAENAIPAIIDRELFDRVQEKLHVRAAAPARGKAKVEYLLSGKIFCGHCGGPMDGDSGTSARGTVHYYYSCANHRLRKGCTKRSVRKEWIEDIVYKDAVELLTPERIHLIAETAIEEYRHEIEIDGRIPALEEKLTEINKGLRNLTRVIETGSMPEVIVQRINELEQEKKQCEKELALEKQQLSFLTVDLVEGFLRSLIHGQLSDKNTKKRIINLFVNSVTVWDEPDGGLKITTAYNLTTVPNKTFRIKPGESRSDLKGDGAPA